MAKSIEISKLEEICQCSICLDRFEDPRTLNCQHSFCKDCLENSLIKCGPKSLEIFIDVLVGCAKLHCPLCRDVTTVPVQSDTDPLEILTGNFQLKQLVELLNEAAPIPKRKTENESKGKGLLARAFQSQNGGRIDNRGNSPSQRDSTRSSNSRHTVMLDDDPIYINESGNVLEQIGSFFSLVELMKVNGDLDNDSTDSDDSYENWFDHFQCATCGSYNHVDGFCPWNAVPSADCNERSNTRQRRNNRHATNAASQGHGTVPSPVHADHCRGNRGTHRARDTSWNSSASSRERGFVKCYRCGRNNHTHKNCHARYHAHGHYLNDNRKHCYRCGHKSHLVESCRAEFSVDGFRITY